MADLQALVERAWTTPGVDDSPVRVSSGPLPPGFTVAEEYAVLPNAENARMLVPVGASAAVGAAFSRRFSTLHGARERGYRSGLAAGYRVGAVERLCRDRLVVGMDQRVPRRDWPQWLLLSHLEATLGVSELVALIPVRRAMPNTKPAFRLFDRAGRPHGYAKLGWSPATRAVVRDESLALSSVQGRLSAVQVPRPLAAGSWRGSDYVVAEPLPPDLRPWRTDPLAAAHVLRDIAASGVTTRAPLSESSYLRRTLSSLSVASHVAPELGAALRTWLESLSHHETPLVFGRWHGDWVPWNVASSDDGGVVAWDWEYSHPDVPVGFDLLHWHYQRRLAAKDGTIEAAVQALYAAQDQLSALSVPADMHRTVASLYLIEMLTRSLRLAAAGAGWNPRVYPPAARLVPKLVPS